MKIISIFILLAFLAAQIQSKICDPDVCSTGCCDINKNCPVFESDCFYYSAFEYTCTSDSDCPEGYTC